MRPRNAVIAWVGLLTLLAAVVLGIGLSTSVAYAQDNAPAASPAAQPETCAVCHKGAGDTHQTYYDQLYQDGVIKVSDIAYSFTPTGTTTVNFKVTKDGQPVDAKSLESLSIYFANYMSDGSFGFDPEMERVSLKGDMTYADGVSTSTLVSDIPDFSSANGYVVVYGYDGQVGTLPERIRQVKYPFAGLLQVGSPTYVSAANNAGCVKCHTDPYLKHGNIYAQVDGDPATDFITCKACHQDNGTGGHFEWQLLVDDPKLAQQYLAGEVELTDAQKEQYGYKTRLMNDVHMSHAMEFPYPQSMANCATCHEGKLDVIQADKFFTLDTCKSCHPMNGSEEAGTAERSITSIMAAVPDHESVNIATDSCTSCHGEGGEAPGLAEIHSGYDHIIYNADGVKWSDLISVTIDSASVADNKLTVQFSAHQAAEETTLDAATITPTMMVGLYGWDTKDFVVGPHERLTDDNGDGAIDSKDGRALEFVVGSENPRFTVTKAEGGSWEITADISQWADLVTSGEVKRVEVGVMPTLMDDHGDMLALNAPSRTFDLGANAFADDFYAPIVKTVDGCNNCHDALATTFHSPDRGGNIVVCRMCHITKAGASHLEMQSRSIDSYVHAIHSGQAFDVGQIDFSDPVAAMEYEHHIGFPYPKHGITDCTSCHNADTFNPPDQAKSLPGILSASAVFSGTERAIGEVPSVVTGPAARACGGCHRAALINEDNWSDLVVLDQHMKQGGYAVPAGDKPVDTWTSVVDEIMGIFGQ